MSGKIIIKNDSEMDDLSALHYVIIVMQGGRVSNDGKQYCYVTKFTSRVTVYSDLTESGSDVFRVAK